MRYANPRLLTKPSLLANRLGVRQCVTEDWNAAVIACGKASEWQKALHILSWSRRQNLQVRAPWNPAISACARAVQWQRAELLLRSMQHRGPQPTLITFGAVLDAHAKGAVWHRAIALLKLLRRKRQLDAVAVTAVIQACGNVEKWQEALALFSAKLVPGDHVMLGATAAACRGMWEASLGFLEIGWRSRLVTGKPLYGTCLTAMASAARWKQALAIFEMMEEQSLTNETALAATGHAMSSASLWREALELLGQLDAAQPALWGTAVNAASRGYHWTKALDLLERQQSLLQVVKVDLSLVLPCPPACVPPAGPWRSRHLLMPVPRLNGDTKCALWSALAACQHAALWEQALHLIREAGDSQHAMLAPLGALDPSPNAVCFGAGLQACRTTGQSWDSNIRSGFFSQTLSEDFSDYGEAVVKLRDGSREMLVILMIEALL
ncbi:unnamed protein product [Cladocopium goreaui]|uniref:Alpha-ketoglutarate-dependent dioxygenase AlkB-like domain-containing protein n=1 Tax=Cladocopium goreaui TaxID=2562237 RepID=A0A9P1FFH3_9DINO|nr:unnamed protein product [Cladocopium goreaui]